MSWSFHLRVSAERSLTVKVTEVTFHSEWKERKKKDNKIQRTEDGKKVKSYQNLVFQFGVDYL